MPNFEHRCVVCDNFVRLFGTFVCNISEKIIVYPFREGRFCETFKKRCQNEGGCSCNDDTKTG